jgi:hypothetical protein
MKIFNIVFIILFIIFAALQYNDPDPYLWIPLYLSGAFLCYYSLKKTPALSLYYVALLIYAAYAVYLFFDKTGVLSWATKHGAENIAETMKATKPWIEETREFFGLVILIIVTLTDLRWIKNRKDYG